MNVLSVFDGISCGQVALDRVGIKVDSYHASEVEKNAIKVTQHNYPKTTQLGDVTKWREWDLPEIDLLIGGSPCQGLSIAKRDRQNLEDPRSKLFYEFIDIMNYYKPKYFLLENVPMNKESMLEFTHLTGVEPVFINSNLVSAQERKRYYWTNIPNITQPSDKGLVIKDIRFECADTRHRNIDHIAQRKTKNYLQFDPNNTGKSSYDARVYYDESKFGTLRAGGNVNYVFCCNGDIRRMHPVEWERLQTLPENYTDVLSNTWRYKTIGNGWTVDVIAHILKGIK